MLRTLPLSAAIGNWAGRLRRPFVVGSLLYVAAVLYAADSYIHGDSKLAVIELSVAVLGPLALFFILRAPLIFPFCAYILVLPADSLSSLGSGGTLAKLVGALTIGALMVRVFRRNCIAPPAAAGAWAALLLWMGVSMFWALDLGDAMRIFQMYASLFALYFALALMRVSKRDLNFVLGSVVLAGLISAGYDAYLYHSGQSVILASKGVSRVIISVGDASIDPNALASALILPWCVALYWLFNSRNFALSFLMIPVLVVLLLGFAASGSRGGFTQLGAVFVYLVFRSRHRLWLATLMAVATVTTLIANPSLPTRFATAEQDGAAGRRDVWHVGLYAFRDHWLVGAGVGNFPSAYDREYINVFTQYILGWHWVAHNVPLTMATELGVVGFAVFLFAVVKQFLTLRNLARIDSRTYELRLALEAACIGIVISGFSASNLNSKYVWLTFSIMVVYRGFLISEQRKTSADSSVAATVVPRARPSNTPFARRSPTHRVGSQ